MRNGVLAALFLLGVSGCLTADPPSTPAGTIPGHVDFSHLSGVGARIVDTPETRSFVWDGQTPAHVYAAAILRIARTPPVAFEFQVDATVGYVEASVTHGATDPLEVGLLDERGRIACAIYAPAPGAHCNTPVPRDAASPRSWRAYVSYDPGDMLPTAQAGGVPFELNVTLHPPPHLVLGDSSEGTDARFAFRQSDTGVTGGEPTLGVNAEGDLFVIELLKTLRSRDGGRTWDDVSPPLQPPRTFDPMLHVDPWTGRVFSLHLSIACTTLSWSDDEGDTWTTNPAACGVPLNDHPKLATGDALLPSPLYDGTVYLSSTIVTDLVGTPGGVWVSRSFDGGATWGRSLALSRLEFPYLIGGTLAADRNGNVYVPAYAGRPARFEDGRLAIAVSNDHGATFATRVVGQGHRIEDVDPAVAVDEAGNAYGMFLDSLGVHVTISQDSGASWGPLRTVSPPRLRSFVLGDAVAGDPGRVAIAYVATADTDRGPHQADGWARWHLYLTSTENALEPQPTWTTALVTPADDPVQIGTICQLYVNCFGNDRNLLDFIDLQPGPDGRVYIAYTDGCRPGCETPPDSRARAGMVAVQDAGPRLFVERAPWARTAGTQTVIRAPEL